MNQVVSSLCLASTRHLRPSVTRTQFLVRHHLRPAAVLTQISSLNHDYEHQTTISRTFSSTNDSNHNNNNSNKPKDFTKLQRLEDANPERIRSIQVDPESVGHHILPGNLVYKYYKRTGNTRKVPVELEYGYFWMMHDLKNTNDKPTLSNEKLVPEHQAQTFPLLQGVKTLNGYKTDLPFYFTEGNDGNGKGVPKCTLVALSFRDYGYKFLSSWTEPFANEFQDSTDCDVVKISITERSSLYVLQWLLTSIMRRNTPVEEHDKTLLYFGNVDEFRDVLRLHNLMTGFVFLVDDLGRIRFAGSGPASDEEIARVIGFAKELSPTTSNTNSTSSSRRNTTSSHNKGRPGRRGGVRTKRQRQ